MASWRSVACTSLRACSKADLHILLGKRQRLPGNLRPRAGHRRHRLAGCVEEHAERLFCLIDGLFGQITQLGRDFKFWFNHGRLLHVALVER